MNELKHNLVMSGTLFLSLIFLASCKTTKGTLSTVTNSKATITSEYQTLIDSIYIANPKSIGIMVHVETPEKGISWSGSAGYSDFGKKVKATPDQPALIASSIKTYISATILRLQEERKLSIEDASKKFLTAKTIELFESDGYDLSEIKIKHLLSHTSGIQDYANEAYLDWIDKNQKHRWTRSEQLELAIEVGDPLGKPEDVFSYADANFLLCTEIIESVTDKPFYSAVRELLRYKELGFEDTWFPTLETKNSYTKALVHQYWAEKNWDSHEHDISWDLYGGGGIATTTEELAKFSYKLFNGEIIRDQNVLNLIFTQLPTRDGQDLNYCLGVNEVEIKGVRVYGHGGFWGTVFMYSPELKTAIAVFILDRSEGSLRKDVLEAFISKFLITY